MNNYFNFDEFKKQLEELTNLENLANKVNELKEAVSDKYNDVMDNTIRKYDLDTQEGYENFIKDVSELRKDLEANDGFFSKYLLNGLDAIVADVMKKHEAKKIEKKNNLNELINKEVEREKKENNGKLNINENKCDKECHCIQNDIDYPSNKLSKKEQRNIWKIVDEYMDTMVIPYLNKDVQDDDELIDDMSSGLFEFAAWLWNKDED